MMIPCWAQLELPNPKGRVPRPRCRTWNKHVCLLLGAIGAFAIVLASGCGRDQSTKSSATGGPGAAGPAPSAKGGEPSATQSSEAPSNTSAPPEARGPCGDERDELIAAYKELGIGVEPKCDDFTLTRRSEYFDFPNLVGQGGHKWALIRDPMVQNKSQGYGLDLLREAYGAAREINSAYRDPIHNKKIGGAARSRHVFGDAADVRNVTRLQEEWDRMWAAAQKAGADWIEPLNGPCKLNCLHADWRNTEGDYGE